MGCELDGLMWEAWVRVRDRVLGDEAELRRRLARRERVFEQVPRALCIAIRASDRRITEMNALILPRHAVGKGYEAEHEVQITSELMRQLCRPVEMEWLTEFRTVSRKLGSYEQRCRELECQGIVKGHRIAGLAGSRGKPVPLVTSGVSAMGDASERREFLLLDACARENSAPHELLVPYWRELGSRVPGDIEQMLVRRPVYRMQRGRRFMRGWTWVCPGCGREAKTIYFPMGSADWAGSHGITLPEAWYDAPRQPSCFACYGCHHLMHLPRSSRKALRGSWNRLIGHLSGGLLYGREVRRPDSFGVVLKNQAFTIRRPTPRRDELESYLAETDMSLGEIARRMGLKERSVERVRYQIYRVRGVKGRKELAEWWARKRLKEGTAAA